MPVFLEVKGKWVVFPLLWKCVWWHDDLSIHTLLSPLTFSQAFGGNTFIYTMSCCLCIFFYHGFPPKTGSDLSFKLLSCVLKSLAEVILCAEWKISPTKFITLYNYFLWQNIFYEIKRISLHLSPTYLSVTDKSITDTFSNSHRLKDKIQNLHRP